MAGKIVLASAHTADLEFCALLAERGGWTVQVATNRDLFRSYMVDSPEALVFWSADRDSSHLPFDDIFPKYVKPMRLFTITEKPLHRHPELFKFPIFNHNLARNFGAPVPEITLRLIEAIQSGKTGGLSSYFPEKTKLTQLSIGQVQQRSAAIQAINNHLERLDIRGRLAALVAKTADEFVLNAIDHAPEGAIVNGALVGGKTIEIEQAAADGYMGICVRDPFGTLSRKTTFETLSRHFHKSHGTGKHKDDLGLGFFSIARAGLSLLLHAERGVMTEAMIFFPRASNHKEFRAGFRFFSVMIK